MEDIGLFKQAWQWLRSQKDTCCRARTAVSFCRDKTGLFIERHWPMVCSGCFRLGRLLRLSLIYWKDCVVRGFQSFIKLGSASLLLIMWCFFLSLTSMHCLIYVLISMVSIFFWVLIFDLVPNIYSSSLVLCFFLVIHSCSLVLSYKCYYHLFQYEKSIYNSDRSAYNKSTTISGFMLRCRNFRLFQ